MWCDGAAAADAAGPKGSRGKRSGRHICQLADISPFDKLII